MSNYISAEYDAPINRDNGARFFDKNSVVYRSAKNFMKDIDTRDYVLKARFISDEHQHQLDRALWRTILPISLVGCIAAQVAIDYCSERFFSIQPSSFDNNVIRVLAFSAITASLIYGNKTRREVAGVNNAVKIVAAYTSQFLKVNPFEAISSEAMQQPVPIPVRQAMKKLARFVEKYKGEYLP